jgi:preprotein translocase subunit SecA
MIYDVSDDIVSGHKVNGDFEDFKLAIIRVFGYDTHITAAEFAAQQPQQLIQRLYDEALGYYHSKNEVIGESALPLINDLISQNAPFENIAVPFSDQRKQVTAVANLRKAQANQGLELIRAMEKVVALSIIDEAWTQHLRAMDDLKQVVQNAVYEQKDPLLVYKFESFELFKRMISKVNEDTVTFLFHADIPASQAGPTDEPEIFFEEAAAAPRMPQPKLKAEKEVSTSSLGAGPEDLEQAHELGVDGGVLEKQVPVRSQKVANRNDKVSVQYMDGRIVRDVKFKQVEEDVLNNRAVLID